MRKRDISNERIKEDLKIVLDYLWRDEENHFLESNYRKNHIFLVLKRLAKAVEYEFKSK